MAKKRSTKSAHKTIRRTSTMQKVISEGTQFLEDTKKKKPTRTRTMAQTIKEGNSHIKRKAPKKVRDDSRSESIQPKPSDKKAKKITKLNKVSRVATGGKPEPSSRKTTSKKATGSKKSVSMGKSVSAHLSHPANIPVKKTIFKTKSKDHLPLPAFGFIDVCFCIDTTGSMSGELSQAQSTIRSIISNIEKKVQTEGLTLRFAVVAYRDHPPQDHTYVTQSLDFTDSDQAISYVNKLNATGGGDFPEAVHDGLITCANKLNWVQVPGSPVLRYIFHIADAPPHGNEFGNSHQKQGCLCGLQTKDVFHAINVKQIHYRLIKARTNPQLNQMADLFQKNIVDFANTDISHAMEMDVKVSDMIIHEMVPV